MEKTILQRTLNTEKWRNAIEICEKHKDDLQEGICILVSQTKNHLFFEKFLSTKLSLKKY